MWAKGKYPVEEEPPGQQGPENNQELMIYKQPVSSLRPNYELQLHSKHQGAPSPPPEVSVGGGVFFFWELFFPQIKLDLVLAGYIHRGSQSLRSYPGSGQEAVGFRAMRSNLNKVVVVVVGDASGVGGGGGGSPPQRRFLCWSVIRLHPLRPLHAENQSFGF